MGRYDIRQVGDSLLNLIEAVDNFLVLRLLAMLVDDRVAFRRQRVDLVLLLGSRRLPFGTGPAEPLGRFPREVRNDLDPFPALAAHRPGDPLTFAVASATTRIRIEFFGFIGKLANVLIAHGDFARSLKSSPLGGLTIRTVRPSFQKRIADF
jgi:hypothetical protein